MFRSVCEAVHYAHQNLVIHRDLKPGNILVDTSGTPKLLDFGIAKLLSAGEDGDEPPTQTLAPMMTPEYASPEQIKGDPITTASDVYSLGVLLYELLTGEHPYPVKGGSLEEIVRSVCETDPAPPSTVARRRSSSPDGARRRAAALELRGDLDTIVLKALRKEPERRYVSAHELAEDVRRYLERRPVAARKDTLGYRFTKLVARNRGAAVAAGLVLLSLLGGLLASLQQARIARAERARAERRFDEVRGLANFVLFDMHDSIVSLPGSTSAREKLAAKALEYLDGLAGEAGDDPVLRAEMARGYTRLATVRGLGLAANLGESSQALESIQKAIRLLDPRGAASPADPVHAAELASSYGVLSQILRQQGKRAETEGALEKMRSLLESIPSRFADDTIVLSAWERFHSYMGGEQADSNDLQSLRETRLRQVEFAEELHAREPESRGRQRSLALAYKNLGAVLQALGEWTRAGELYTKALELDRKVVEAEPFNPHYKLDLSFSHASIGWLRWAEGDLEGSVAGYTDALDLRQHVYAEDPDNQFAFSSLVRVHQSLAAVHAAKDDLERAIAQQRAVLDLRTGWEKRHPSTYGTAAWQASFHGAVGDAGATIASLPGLADARRREHWRRARAEYAKGLAIWMEVAKGRPLEGEHAGEPKRLEEAIARCDDALAKLAG
jgi:non-specific serine/threonine protein kinase/serine/threonine-protein kinase